MLNILRCCLVVIAVSLTACASDRRVSVAPDSIFRDSAFATVGADTGAGQIMAISHSMRDYLQRDLAPSVEGQGAMRGLVAAMTQPDGIRLRYDSSRTNTATEAFDSRSGNCLSLVILTAALARELGLQVYFQEVVTDDVWSRLAGLYVASGHVNVTISRSKAARRQQHDNESSVTIDFLPPSAAQVLRTRQLAERTVLAMFMNNRAVEALAQPDLPLAYAWASAAVRQDPDFLSAYNTLAVVYMRSNLHQAAEVTLRHLLELNPKHTQALSNLVLTLSMLGRHDEAHAVSNRLRQLEVVAPFEYYNKGMAALRSGDAVVARDWFRRELARDSDYHEFHFALALAEWKLGNAEEARKELVLARDNSLQRSEYELYAAKLAHIQGLSGTTRSIVQ